MARDLTIQTARRGTLASNHPGTEIGREDDGGKGAMKHDRAQLRDRTVEGGYSLPEVLLSLGLLALVAALGSYSANTGPWRSSVASAELARRLDDAAHRARAYGHTVIVSVDPADGSVRVHDDLDGDQRFDPTRGETRTTFPLSRAADGMILTTLSGRRGIDGAWLDDNANQTAVRGIVFAPTGNATPAVLYLVPQEDASRRFDGNARAVSIAASGRVQRWRLVQAGTATDRWELER